MYADGADKSSLLSFYQNPTIKGFTTNLTLMHKAGISDYESYAKEILSTVIDKPISFEVFADDFATMKKEAFAIQKWQSNVFVKIPITNTKGESAVNLIKELSKEGIQLNVTAMLTEEQVAKVVEVLNPDVPSILSVFAGRIADTGRDPVQTILKALEISSDFPKAKLLWASVREILNIRHANDSGCHIVTVPHAIMAKAMKLWDMDLNELSLQTVKMFRDDAVAAGYRI